MKPGGYGLESGLAGYGLEFGLAGYGLESGLASFPRPKLGADS